MYILQPKKHKNIMFIILVTILISATLNSLAILGLQGAAHEGNILHPILEWLNKNLGTMATKPILGCPQCMASVWGGVPCACLLITQHHHAVFIAATTIAYTCIVSGLIRILSLVMDYLDR